MLSPVVAGALRAVMAERLVVNHAQQTRAEIEALATAQRVDLCDWCLRLFDASRPRYLVDDAAYCSLGCKALDTEVVE